MSYAYQRVTGQLPPTFYSILLPTAQSALETSSWKAMWNWNAGNVTTGKPNTDAWIDLSSLSAATAGIKFKAYGSLGDGCIDMLTWLQKRGVLALAANGDVGAYTNGLAANCYAGCPGQPGAANYQSYASLLYADVNRYRNVTPQPYGEGLGLIASWGIGAFAVGILGLGLYALLPESTTSRLLGASEDDEERAAEDVADESADRTENPLESDEESADEPDHEGDERAEEESEEDRKHIAEVSPSHVQTLLFRREDGWTKTKARTWVRSHPAYHFGKVDETANYIRVRQMDPVKFEPKSFRTITFGKGIKAVIGRRKTG